MAPPRLLYKRWQGTYHVICLDDEYLMTHVVLNSIDIPLSIKFMEDSYIFAIPIRSLSREMKQNADANMLEASMLLNSTLTVYNTYLEERIFTLQCMDAD